MYILYVDIDNDTVLLIFSRRVTSANLSGLPGSPATYMYTHKYNNETVLNCSGSF